MQPGPGANLGIYIPTSSTRLTLFSLYSPQVFYPSGVQLMASWPVDEISTPPLRITAAPITRKINAAGLNQSFTVVVGLADFLMTSNTLTSPTLWAPKLLVFSPQQFITSDRAIKPTICRPQPTGLWTGYAPASKLRKIINETRE